MGLLDRSLSEREQDEGILGVLAMGTRLAAASLHDASFREELERLADEMDRIGGANGRARLRLVQPI